MQSFRDNFFAYTLVPLLVCVAAVSYVRFMVLNDYVVAYESDCDPYSESCFIGCEDDECVEEYYYSVIQKYAPNVEAQCGVDITDCDAAYECLPEDRGRCEITHCDPDVDGEDSCETLTESDFTEEELEGLFEDEVNEATEASDEFEGGEEVGIESVDGANSEDVESSMEANLETTYDL